MTKNESKTDFLHKISTDFVCIFQIFRFFSEIEAKWKSNLENDLYWLWPWNIKMYQTHWNFPTCLMLQRWFLVWAISSYFITIIKNHPVVELCTLNSSLLRWRRTVFYHGFLCTLCIDIHYLGLVRSGEGGQHLTILCSVFLGLCKVRLIFFSFVIPDTS